jgi:hypothetical protein
MTTAIDVPTGLDDFFKAQGSTEAQRADAIAVLKNECGMVSGVVILTPTGETLDSDKSKAWIAEHKPHLLPPKFERSLADRAFADGNLSARGEPRSTPRAGSRSLRESALPRNPTSL